MDSRLQAKLEKASKTGRLDISNLGLTSLPKFIGNITHLNCSGNKIVAILDLPETLIELDCANNRLTFLPDLPANLEFLSCSKNKLTMIPELPLHVSRLYGHSNPWNEQFAEFFRNLNTIVSIRSYYVAKKQAERDAEIAEIAKQAEIAKSWKTFTGKNGQAYYANSITGERTYDAPQ